MLLTLQGNSGTNLQIFTKQVTFISILDKVKMSSEQRQRQSSTELTSSGEHWLSLKVNITQGTTSTQHNIRRSNQ